MPKKMGRPTLFDRSDRVTIRMPSDLSAEIREHCRETGRNLSLEISALARAWLESQPQWAAKMVKDKDI